MFALVNGRFAYGRLCDFGFLSGGYIGLASKNVSRHQLNRSHDETVSEKAVLGAVWNLIVQNNPTNSLGIAPHTPDVRITSQGDLKRFVSVFRRPIAQFVCDRQTHQRCATMYWPHSESNQCIQTHMPS